MKNKILIIALTLLVLCVGTVTAAPKKQNAKNAKAASSGELRLSFRDIPAVTKAAFEKLDPVFQSGLKQNAAIAVFPISTDNNDDSEGMYEALQILIVNSNRYTIVEKRHVDDLLAEHDFQQSGLISTDSAVNFGRLLGADAVILGAVGGKGSDRELSLIGVDMQNRKTLAVANESWPQAYEGGAKGRTAAGRIFPEGQGLGNVLLLPPLGGSRDENITLGNLMGCLKDINDACNLINETENTALLPANFTGTRYEDNQLLYKLALQHKANYIIHTSIQKFGQRNLAVISRYNTYSKLNDSVYYLDYIDPVEAWIKLPSVVSVIMKTTQGGNRLSVDTLPKNQNFKSYNFWLRYKDGVDRTLADRAIGLLMNDYAVAGNNGILINKTTDLENAIIARQGDETKSRFGMVITASQGPMYLVPNADWKTYTNKLLDDIKNKTNFDRDNYKEALKALYFDVGIIRMQETGSFNWNIATADNDTIFIEASRQGNKTRLLVFQYDFVNPSTIVSLDFSDLRDFIRQMRGLSLSIASGKATAGYDLGIVRGAKWNYWKYKGEISDIADIITYTKPYPKPPELRVEERGIRNAHFTMPLSGDILLYYAKENDFSKAVLADVAEVRTTNIKYQNRVRNAFNLEPKTQYYFWAVGCYGHLIWLQSEPSAPIIVNTREQRANW